MFHALSNFCLKDGFFFDTLFYRRSEPTVLKRIPHSAYIEAISDDANTLTCGPARCLGFCFILRCVLSFVDKWALAAVDSACGLDEFD